MKLNCEKVKKQLRGEDVDHFECGWWWGMAPTGDACGLEMYGLPSCKYVYKGQRTCLLVKFDEAAVFCKSSMGSGAQITLDKVKNFVAGADEGLMVAIAKHVTLFKVIQPSGTTLYVPSGWLVYEKVDNQEDASGWRWTLLSDQMQGAFPKIASMMLPDSMDKVEANSGAMLIAKFLVALQQSAGGSPLLQLEDQKKRVVNDMVAAASVSSSAVKLEQTVAAGPSVKREKKD